MSSSEIQVTVGFKAGQVLTLRAAPEQVTELRGALAGVTAGSGWFQLQADDGAVDIELSAVAYLRVESDEHRVGFRA